MVVRAFEAQHDALAVHHERIHIEIAGDHVEKRTDTVEVNLSEVRLFGVMRNDISVVIEQEDDSAFVLVDTAAECLLEVLHFDIFGDHALHMLALVAYGRRDRKDLLVVRLAEIGPRNGDQPVIAGSLKVPVLRAEFGNALIEGVASGADVFAIRRTEIHVEMLVAVILEVLLENRFRILLVDPGGAGYEFRERLLALGKEPLARFDSALQRNLGTAVSRRNKGIFKIVQECKNKQDGNDDNRYRVNKGNSPTEFTAFCIYQVLCQIVLSLNCS